MNPKKALHAVLSLLAFSAGLSTGCAHKSLDPDALGDIERLAVVVRVKGTPEIELATVDPGEGRWSPGSTPEEADAALARLLAQRVTPFQMEERIRGALIAQLPTSEPWRSIMPGVEVATALDTLLVEDRAEPLNYAILKERGSNAVLEIVVDRYGLHHVKGSDAPGKTGFYLEGKARMFHIDGGVLWKAPLAMDEARLPGFDGLDVVTFKQGSYHDDLINFSYRLTSRIARELSGASPDDPKLPDASPDSAEP